MRPVVGQTTERIFETLPEHYRGADETLGDGPSGWPLLRYLSLIGDQASDVEDLFDRLVYTPPDEGGAPGDTSDLVDPDTADAAWLQWLAQMVGVTLEPKLTEAEKRDAIRFASAGWRAGTKQAVAEAAQTALTGTKYAKVYDHRVSRDVPGGIWDVLIITRTTETPDVAAVLATVIARGAKPAGVVLRVVAYEASWDTIEAAFPTWDDIEAAGDWDTIQEEGAI